MSTGRKHATRGRNRSVRLTSDAIQSLEARIAQKWATQSPGRKLTREARADLLGISAKTADRVLSGEGVDRATLLLAFHSVGLKWDDKVLVGSGPEQAGPSSRRANWLVPVSVTLCVLILAASIVLASKPGAPESSRWPVNKLINDATDLYFRGDYARAESMLMEALRRARERRDAGQMACAQRVLADLAIFHGDLRGAESRLQQCVVLRQSLQQSYMLPSLYEALGDVAKLRADYTGSHKYYQLALKGFDAERDPVGKALVQRDLGSLSHLQRDTTRAKMWFHKAVTSLQGLDKPDILADIKAREAEVLASEGRFQNARQNLIEAQRHWVAEKHTRWIALTELQLSRLDRAEGNREQCLAKLARARAGFVKVGDKVNQKLVDVELAQVQASNPPPRSSF